MSGAGKGGTGVDKQPDATNVLMDNGSAVS
jgi:hypothetical protein